MEVFVSVLLREALRERRPQLRSALTWVSGKSEHRFEYRCEHRCEVASFASGTHSRVGRTCALRKAWVSKRSLVGEVDLARLVCEEARALEGVGSPSTSAYRRSGRAVW